MYKTFEVHLGFRNIFTEHDKSKMEIEPTIGNREVQVNELESLPLSQPR